MEQNSNHIKAVLKGCVRADLGRDAALVQIKSYLPENGKGKDDVIKSAIKKACGHGVRTTKDLGKSLDGLVSDIFSVNSKSFGDAEEKTDKKGGRN